MPTGFSRQAIKFVQAKNYALLLRLWRHLTYRRKVQLALMLGLIFISALTEVVSLGAVVPFIGILTAPERVLAYPGVALIAQNWGIDSAEGLVLPVSLVFAFAAVLAGAIRLLLLWVNTKLTHAIGAELSVEAYRRTLYQPYQVHVARNSSTVISGITLKVGIATSILMAMLQLITAVVMVVTITFTLLLIDVKVALIAATTFGTAYFLIGWLSRRKLEGFSAIMAREQTQVVKALQEGLGGIRDVLLDGNQPLYSEIFSRAQTPLSLTGGQCHFVAQSPRPAMESLGMVLIALLAYVMSREQGGISEALPLLAALALGAQRLLPALQQTYVSWAGITGSMGSLADALELLDQATPPRADTQNFTPLVFRNSMEVESLKFRYTNDGPWVLNNLDLKISKGYRIGFVGGTGSGKSTLLDLLMGLLEPVSGQIKVDGLPIVGTRLREWQRTIAHVPQNIYLADTTLAENIAFGVIPSEIDMDRVLEAARKAQISEYIEAQPDGYHAFVGERGVRLSGGQRQRIGIARALYKRASVLVFDEATSALDNATEKMVMGTIEELGRELTILLIAHRLTTVMHCDTIVELGHGCVIAQGTYDQLVANSESFRRMANAVA
jgi:ABC-type multidrug transport system fused ATPase/permease subunit